jgi:serine/threonine protein kinase/Tfp pilus assembly protein PilF
MTADRTRDQLSDDLQRSLGSAYTLERELGGGGMSRVFLARDEALGRSVVVKVLAPELAAELSVERFAREIRLAARLQHPNIVPVHSADESEGLPYYTMPFVDGASLRARLDAGRLSPNEARWILRDVAKALAHAHRQGVVHRDIKPENILLAHDTAVVTDFGVARAVTAAATTNATGSVTNAALTRLGTAVGTPAYMAPEQAAGDPDIDARADVYAWGLVADEVLSGRHPFADRRTVHALVTAHLTEAPAPLTVPGEGSLAALVMRCLEKDPALRPANGNAIVDALEPTRESADLSASAPKAVLEPAVAVLPFANLSSDPENEYLSDGLTDEIIGTLGRVRGLRVAGRASCFALKGQRLDARTAAERLGVTAVVEGSVRRAGNRIRVSVELVQATDGFQLWSDRYDRDLTDVFAVQEEIAETIAGALTARLTTSGPRAEPPRAVRPANPEAYRLCLQAKHILRNQFTPEAFDRSLALLDAALAADPNLALAHAVRANFFNQLAVYGLRAPHAIYPAARESALRAIALDPGSAEAWSIEGQVAYAYDWNWARADECFERALAADPDDPGALGRATIFYAACGREADAVACAHRFAALDPLAAGAYWIAGCAYRLLRRPDDAIAACREALVLNPHHAFALNLLGALFLDRGDPDAALEAYDRAYPLMGYNPIGLAGICVARAMRGEVDLAEAALAELTAKQDVERPAASWVAFALINLGRIDDAMEWLARSLEAREFFVSWLAREPWCDPVRGDPRFEAMLKRVGMPQVTNP